MRLTLLLLALLLVGPAVHAADGVPAEGITPTQCGPGESGSPCDGSGPASLGNTSETNQGAGNPINVITGNKYQREVDLPALPGVLGLEIVRHYNSVLAGSRTPPGITGRGWRLSYETDLNAIGNTLQIIQADGTRTIFIRDPRNPSQCATNNPAHGRVTIQKTARGETYQWTWPNGRTLSFNHQGKLIQIKAPTGEFVTLTRDLAGALVKVTDPQGRSLVLGYPAKRDPSRFNGVTHIDSPVGRFTYAYGSTAPKGYAGNPRDLLANLIAVTFPDAVSRRYHYEDPAHATLLTGLSVSGGRVAGQGAQPQRLNTWAYDAQGRGILSVKGHPKRLDKSGKPVPGTGIEQVELDFRIPGKTVLTNSLDQTTTYTHAIVGGEYRLLEVRGTGCASCGESNIRYGYDKLGRLIEETRLGHDGTPVAATRTERDGQGRTIKISTVAYVNGKSQPARLIARYEYQGADARPILIARPSVVAGKEHQIRVTYNPFGQPLMVTETGFSPAVLPPLPYAVAGGGGDTQPTAITRTTTYAYRNINGRSLLAQIDGPLANGSKNDPSDSDVTRVEWDSAGRNVIRMTQPGGAASRLDYDASGRIVSVQNAEGFTTKATYNFRGQVLSTASFGATWSESGIQAVAQSYRYDALGNRIETGVGGIDGMPFRPRTLQAYDAAGRLLWQAEALGIVKQARYDTEGNLLGSTVRTRSFEQSEHYRYDEHNRLIEIADSTGSVRRVSHANLRPSAVSAFRVLRDDFGREVFVASASHGVVAKRYDAADRLIEQHNDNGDVQTYAYDLMGQRVRHSVLPKAGMSQTTTWRYAQGRLVEVADPVQKEHIRYDARGLPETKTVVVKLADGGEATHVTRYTYTTDGSLASESLPDGTRIEYERNGQGQIVAVTRRTSPWTFFSWGKQTLVKNLERDLIGLRSVTYGNGIHGQWQRSKQGVLARVVYVHSEGRAADPSRTAAVTRGAVRQSVVGSLLEKLIPAAHAQTPTPGNLPGALGIPADPGALFDARLLYDAAGNVLLQQQQGQGPQATQAYAYDQKSQLIAAQSAARGPTVKTAAGADASPVWRYHYDYNGNRILAQEQVPVAELGQTRKTAYDPESNAMMPSESGREYNWDAQGRLVAIQENGKGLASYRYNHRGLRVAKQTAIGAEHTLYNEQRQRIAELDGEGRIIRQYVWLGDHLIATIDAKQPKALRVPADGFWHELAQTAQALWTSIAGSGDRLTFVHVNHLGAPVAATDESGHAVWQADYAPYGQVTRVSAAASGTAAYTLALRLPGQWEDKESGLYYNDFRYYDPHAGRYLSPDPLGKLAERLGSPNAYAYVNNNPVSYIDPWGLILFAFDGTGNDESNQDTLSNVVEFRNRYQSGARRYVTGVGTEHIDNEYGNIKHWAGNTLDAGANYTGPARIARMIQYFNDEANKFDDAAIMDIDIVGFSRGSAQARDFANRLVSNTQNGWYRYFHTGNDGKEETRCQRVNFRFMGLFDTVLSTNLSGYSYNLGIPEAFSYVAQAVALNEYRGKTLRALPGSVGAFPLESMLDGMYSPVLIAGQTRIERGFLGSHSDIGGGFEQGDLSTVALSWMVDQARSAGVTMDDAPSKIIANPVLHDKSDNLLSPIGVPSADSEDRQVRYGNGSTTMQRAMIAPSGMVWSDTGQFISYLPRTIDQDGDVVPLGDFVTGTVDAQAYLNWLNANGYNINMTVQ